MCSAYDMDNLKNMSKNTRTVQQVESVKKTECRIFTRSISSRCSGRVSVLGPPGNFSFFLKIILLFSFFLKIILLFSFFLKIILLFSYKLKKTTKGFAAA